MADYGDYNPHLRAPRTGRRICPRGRSSRPRRSAFILFDCLVGAILAIALLASCAQLMLLHKRQTEAATAHFAARQIAASTAERLAAVPWEQLEADSPVTRDTLATATNTAAETLRGGKVELDLHRPPDAPGEKCVDVTVSWLAEDGARGSEVTLRLWRYGRQPAVDGGN